MALSAGLPAWALPSVLPFGVPTFLGASLSVRDAVARTAPHAQDTGRHMGRRSRALTPVLSFKCQIDKKAFADCASPKTYKRLRFGKHNLPGGGHRRGGQREPAGCADLQEHADLADHSSTKRRTRLRIFESMRRIVSPITRSDALIALILPLT